jgi:hypothetical protein
VPDCYLPKKISELDLKRDKMVALIGNVLELKEEGFVLGDDSGKIEINSSQAVEPSSQIRVFCTLINQQLNSDLIQDMKNFDIGLFYKVKELYNKSGV